MRRNPLIIGLVLLLGLVAGVRLWVQFGYPLLLKAQENQETTAQATSSGPDNLGPHAAFFDPAGNMKVVTMVNGKTSKSLPITIMVDINADRGSILQQLITVKQAGLQPVIRVVGVTKAYVGDTAATGQIATELSSAIQNPELQGLTSPGQGQILVVFGNELNNLDREWEPGSAVRPGANDEVRAAGQAYAAMFASFRGAASGFIPVPAPPDQHNANYDWNAFVDGAAGAYSGTLVANVYAIGEGVGLVQALEAKQGGSVVFYTEYGPHPNDSLQQHIDFFASTPPAVPATTLIPDKCQSQDHNSDLWLYYVDGSIYNADGLKIDPATCTGSGDTRGEPPEGDYYRRFVYPFYYDDPENQLSLQKEIRQRLANDYTVQCVKPAEYETFLGGDGNINEMFNGVNTLGRGCVGEIDPGACLFKPQASFLLTSAGLQNMFGVLRDERAARWRAYDQTVAKNAGQRSFTNRFESVEQWFGANNPEEEQYYDTTPDEIRETHQGPFYKLANKQMQCVAAAEILEASYKLCQDWQQANPELVSQGVACPLDKRITGTDHTTFSMLSELNATANQIGAAGSPNPNQVVCERFYSAQVGDTGISSQLMEDLLRVDLYMETAYRPAFLVMATQVDPSNVEAGPGNPNAAIRYQEEGAIVPNGSEHIVDFLVYHVPATLTDASQQSEHQAPDVITRTIQSFTPLEKTREFQNQVETERNVMRDQLVVRDAPDVPAPQITCDRPECQEALLAALIDFINVSDMTYALGCEAQHIANKAESGTNPGSRLEPIDESQQLVETKPEGEIDEAEVSIEIQQYYDSNGVAINPRGNAPRTKMFNISPYGYNTIYAAENLRALMTKSQQQSFQQGDGYYRTFEAPLSYNLETFEDNANQYFTREENNGELVNITKEVRGGIKLKDETTPFALHFKDMARVFNHSTRAITTLVTGWGTNTWNCASTVANPSSNTQDFLRNCQRGTAGTDPIPTGDEICAIEGGFEIKSTAVKNMLAKASADYNIPIPVMMAVLWTENCRSTTNYNGKTATICDKTDEELADFLAPSVPYPHTAGCPGQTRREGTGVFQFNLFYWQSYKYGPESNACSLSDSFTDAARWLSSNYNGNGRASDVGTAPERSSWSVLDMERVVSRWAGNSDTCGGHPFSQLYCCVIDQLTTGQSSCGEPWIEQLTPVTTSCH